MFFDRKNNIIKVILFILVINYIFTIISLANSYEWGVIKKDQIIEVNSNIENEKDTLNLESESVILIEQKTGQVLYEKNSHEQLRPASVTKLMSLVPCSENAASMGGSQIWLDTKETLTVEEMIKAICVVSANDYNVQL